MTPSYTFCTLKVSGDRRLLEAFRKSVEGFKSSTQGYMAEFTELDFFTVLPLPKDAYGDVHTLEATRRQVWGTGSEACGVTLKEKNFELIYTFTTFSTPPREVIKAMVRNNPKLKFTFQFKNDRRGVVGAMKIYKDKIGFAQTDKFGKIEELT